MIDATAPGARRARILKRIQREGRVSLADLASEHAVSAVTVHRDLQLLSEEGLLQRVRGGARSLPDPPAQIETGWNARLREAAPEKDAIAAAARELIEDGSTIFIDASSTGLALAHAIELRPPADLTLVTNSPGDRPRPVGGVDPRHRGAGGARPAHARADRPLDDRLPGSVSPSPRRSSRPPASRSATASPRRGPGSPTR